MMSRFFRCERNARGAPKTPFPFPFKRLPRTDYKALPGTSLLSIRVHSSPCFLIETFSQRPASSLLEVFPRGYRFVIILRMYTDVKGMHNGLFLTRQRITVATVNPKLENISL